MSNLREPSIPHGVVEARLLRWGESSTAGRTITLELEPEGDRHPFRDYPSGKTHGQRFMIVFTPKGDDEQPIPIPREGGDGVPSGRSSSSALAAVVPERGMNRDTSAVPPTEPVKLHSGSNTDESEKKRWNEYSLSQQAGILCSDPEFRAWIPLRDALRPESEKRAAEYIRQRCCDMNSRSELDRNPEYAERFNRMLTEYDIYRGRQTDPR